MTFVFSTFQSQSVGNWSENDKVNLPIVTRHQRWQFKKWANLFSNFFRTTLQKAIFWFWFFLLYKKEVVAFFRTHHVWFFQIENWVAIENQIKLVALLFGFLVDDSAKFFFIKAADVYSLERKSFKTLSEAFTYISWVKLNYNFYREHAVWKLS